MDPLVTSTLISTGANMLGGLFGGKQKRGPSVQEQVNAQALAQQTIDRNRPSWLVEGANAAGVHPLVAFGMQPVSAGQISFDSGSDSGSKWGNIAADAGQGLARTIEAAGTIEERQANRMILMNTVRRGELENDLLASQIARMNQQSIPPVPNNLEPSGSGRYATDPNNLKERLRTMATPLGAEDGATPLHKWAYDESGVPMRMFNEEGLGDNDIAQIAHFLRYTAPDYLYGHVGRPAAKALSRGFSKIRSGWRTGKAAGRQYQHFSK